MDTPPHVLCALGIAHAAPIALPAEPPCVDIIPPVRDTTASPAPCWRPPQDHRRPRRSSARTAARLEPAPYGV
jgi:hypothetical protein